MSLQKPNTPLKKLAMIILPIVVLFIIILIFRGVYLERYDPKDTGVNPEQISLTDTIPSILQADDLFSDYMQNNVAFDRNNDDKQIEFEGIIKSISNDFGCSTITIELYRDGFYEIECSNCTNGKDRWADEVAKIRVGEFRVIKGYYSASASSKYSMSFYKCRIVN